MFRGPSFPFDTAARNVQTPRQQPFRSPKVVSIPVHFVGSETASSAAAVSTSTAAIKIQKVWRGFLVRKNVNKILGINKEADAIEERISEKDSAGLIRGDAKERLKVNEMLMALLFRLDSIQGVDVGVRDCRKRVIKKVITLQERVDAIASRDADDQTLISKEEESQADQESAAVVDQTETGDHQLPVECSGNPNTVAQVGEELSDGEESARGEEDRSSESEVEESYLLVNREDECAAVKDAMQESEAAAGNVEGNAEENKNKGLVEKMMEINEILIGLVSELCESNKKQTQMINSLSKRVDDLGKSFRKERSKCKKRKQDAKRMVG